MKSLIWMRLAAGASLAAGALVAADVHKPKTPHPAIGDPEAIEAGRKLFSAGCAGCHGLTGEGGRGPKLRDSGMWHSLDDEALFKTIKFGIPNTEMPGSNQPDEKVWQMTAFVKALGSPAIEAPPPGDLRRGEELFWGKGGCGGCHGLRGKGGKYGPDLTNAGGLRSAGFLRESIIDPDADATEAWRKVTLALHEGGVREGLLRNRNNFSVQLQDAQGEIHLVPASRIKSVTLAKSSPMPADYRQRLDRKEIDDLVAFLSRQSVRPAESALARAGR
jgi:putative heme-binding domain-containing protein